MNERLARQIFDALISATEGYGDFTRHVTLNIVEEYTKVWPAYDWLDWASDWEHEQLAKRYAA